MNVADRARPSIVQWLLYLPALVSFVILLSPGVWRIEDTDFCAFYQTAKAMRLGLDPTLLAMPRPSLSPPTLSLLLWPFTFVPLPWAFGIWTGLGAVLFIAALRRIHRVAPFTPRAIVWIVLANIAALPFFDVWSLGQLGWILFYVVTRAWLAPSAVRAGAWLALAIAIKPPFALMALALPWTITWTAGIASAAIAALTLGITGLQPWIQWWHLQAVVSWMDLPYNLSFFGLLARLQWPAHVTMRQLPVLGLVTILILGLVTWRTASKSSGPRRWGLALLWSCFVSPIGWVHYLPVVLGPLWISWPKNAAMTAGVIFLTLPNGLIVALINRRGWPSVLGLNAYVCGAWLMWIALVQPMAHSSEPAADLTKQNGR